MGRGESVYGQGTAIVWVPSLGCFSFPWDFIFGFPCDRVCVEIGTNDIPSRNPARPVRTCPITGQPAKYRDPRTNVPFANVGAYDVLTKVIDRGYVWCSALGCYVGMNETRQRGGTSREAQAGAETVADGVSMAAGVADPVAEEEEEEEEPTVKRRRVEITDR